MFQARIPTFFILIIFLIKFIGGPQKPPLWEYLYLGYLYCYGFGDLSGFFERTIDFTRKMTRIKNERNLLGVIFCPKTFFVQPFICEIFYRKFNSGAVIPRLKSCRRGAILNVFLGGGGERGSFATIYHNTYITSIIANYRVISIRRWSSLNFVVRQYFFLSVFFIRFDE